MFTGIVSHVAKVEKIFQKKDWEIAIIINDKKIANVNSFNSSLKIGSSVSCSGICLTLKKIENNLLFFDVSNETASITNFLDWNIGTFINIEKSLKVGDEIGGHFVYGHIDTTAKIKNLDKIQGSYNILFEVNTEFSKYIATKGSITIDGVSLTVNNVSKNSFNVNIIPFTWNHTCFVSYKKDTVVNIEIDILARYLERLRDHV